MMPVTKLVDVAKLGKTYILFRLFPGGLPMRSSSSAVLDFRF